MDALRLARIQFAVGVATGIVVEFRFGTNWAEYSMYVGKVLGGVPFDAPGDSTGTFVGLLNPYALLVGVQALAMFTARSSLSPGSSAPASWNRRSRSAHPHRGTP